MMKGGFAAIVVESVVVENNVVVVKEGAVLIFVDVVVLTWANGAVIAETKIDSFFEPTVRPTDSPMVSIEIIIAAAIPTTTFVLKAIDKVFWRVSVFS